MVHLHGIAPLFLLFSVHRGPQNRYCPSNFAIRAVLTGRIRIVERGQPHGAAPRPHLDAMLAN